MRSRTTGRASASPSRPSPPVGTAATAEHRAVFMDALVKAAGAEDFDRTAHFALHFMAARLLGGDAPRDYYAALGTPTTALLRKAFAATAGAAPGEPQHAVRALVEEVRALAKHRSIARELAAAYREFSAEAFYGGGSDEDRKRIFLGLMRGEKDAGAIARLTDASMRCGIPEYELSISTVCWMFSSEFGGTVDEIKDPVSVRKDGPRAVPRGHAPRPRRRLPRNAPQRLPALHPLLCHDRGVRGQDPPRRGRHGGRAEGRGGALRPRCPVRKMGEYKRLITGLGRTLPPRGLLPRHRRGQLRRRRHGGVAHPGHSTSTPASASSSP